MPQLDLDLAKSLAAADGGDGAPITDSLERPECFLPPPPAQFPPNFTPTVVPEDSLVMPPEQGWKEVGGRRRHGLEKAPALPPRRETGISPAFRRRVFGLCFRCLAPDHFFADCRGDVRCLGCRLSGHHERVCKASRSVGQGHSPPAPPGCASDRPACQAAPPAVARLDRFAPRHRLLLVRATVWLLQGNLRLFLRPMGLICCCCCLSLQRRQRP
jgi:hypothetical protein